MKFYIRNMVCSRCIMVIKAELEKAGIQPIHIELGEVDIEKEPSSTQLQQFSNAVKSMGFELIDDRKSKIIDKIKTIIIQLVHHNKEELSENLSAHLSAKLHHDYSYLSNLFSEVEGTTIEKYYIAQKIEKVKELLMYDELSLSQIAFDLGYSSVAHLSSQFKKQTGLTPTFFKSLKENKRRNIEEL